MLYLVCGLLVGTLADYLIHRLVAHAAGSRRSDALLLGRHQNLHHAVFVPRRGMTAKRSEARAEHTGTSAIGLLTLVGLAAAAAFTLTFTDFATMDDAVMAFAGLVLTIVLYDVLHRLHHADIALSGPWRRWHHKHHEEPTTRFATVLPLWDYFFFTHKPLRLPAAGERPSKASNEPAASTRPRTGRRRKSGTSMEALLAQTMEEAEEAA